MKLLIAHSPTSSLVAVYDPTTPLLRCYDDPASNLVKCSLSIPKLEDDSHKPPELDKLLFATSQHLCAQCRDSSAVIVWDCDLGALSRIINVNSADEKKKHKSSSGSQKGILCDIATHSTKLYALVFYGAKGKFRVLQYDLNNGAFEKKIKVKMGSCENADVSTTAFGLTVSSNGKLMAIRINRALRVLDDNANKSCKMEDLSEAPSNAGRCVMQFCHGGSHLLMTSGSDVLVLALHKNKPKYDLQRIAVLRPKKYESISSLDIVTTSKAVKILAFQPGAGSSSYFILPRNAKPSSSSDGMSPQLPVATIQTNSTENALISSTFWSNRKSKILVLFAHAPNASGSLDVKALLDGETLSIDSKFLKSSSEDECSAQFKSESDGQEYILTVADAKEGSKRKWSPPGSDTLQPPTTSFPMAKTSTSSQRKSPPEPETSHCFMAAPDRETEDAGAKILPEKRLLDESFLNSGHTIGEKKNKGKIIQMSRTNPPHVDAEYPSTDADDTFPMAHVDAEDPSTDADDTCLVVQTKDNNDRNIELEEHQKQRQIALHNRDMKLRAITRASIHMSENASSSYSQEFNSSCQNNDDDRPQTKAPTGWTQRYNELYSLLKRGLLGYDPDDSSESKKSPTRRSSRRRIHNVSAILMGPRGQGKSFILERCLADLSVEAGKLRRKQDKQLQQPNTAQKELQQDLQQQAFRVVRLNGLLHSGDNTVACAQEIARQINEMTRMGEQNKMRSPRNNGSGQQRKRARLSDDSEDDHKRFRHRQTGLNTNLAFLDEALRTARIDNIPILIILEELDTFIAKGRMLEKNHEGKRGKPSGGAGNDRQLLLYKLLDRVADNRFLVSLVGITTDLTTVSKFEKRVLSRAEGTSKLIYCGRMSRYDDLVEGLMMSFYSPHRNNLSLPETSMEIKSPYTESEAMIELSKEVEFILRGGDQYGKAADEFDDYTLIRDVLERNYYIKNMDMRWFCRVLDLALSLLSQDLSNSVEVAKASVKFAPSHMAIALNALEASICDVVWTSQPGISSLESCMLLRWGELLGDPDHYSTVVGNDPRLRALLDLSGPQCAILLAARRILARDDTCETEDAAVNARKTGAGRHIKTGMAMTAPLTYQRICDEYTTSFVASGRYTTGADRYPSHVLQRACIDMIELDLIRLKKDHSGGGPFQYKHCDALSKGASIMNIPLHVNIEMHDEFMPLLKAGVLHCSTALREWGMKMS